MKTRDGYVISTKGEEKMNNSIEESIYRQGTVNQGLYRAVVARLLAYTGQFQLI